MTLDVVLPVFKFDSVFFQVFSSIVNQTMKEFNIIIIDDSGDIRTWQNELETIVSKRSCIRLLYLKNKKNIGAGASRLLGIEKSKSTFIAFADSDDIWSVRKLELQYTAMILSGASLSAHKYFHNLELYYPSFQFNIAKISFTRHLFKAYLATPTLMFKRQAINDYLPLRRCDDLYFLFSNFQKKSDINIFVLSDEMYAYGFKSPIGESGLTGSVVKMFSAHTKVLRTLKKRKKILLIEWLFFEVISHVKFALRLTRNVIKNISKC